jgi:DNA-binding NtrC family response regulator
LKYAQRDDQVRHSSVVYKGRNAVGKVQQRTTQTLDAVDCIHADASRPRLIRFFRGDDPFDTPEAFALGGHDTWLLGRIDTPSPLFSEHGRLWSRGDAIMSSRHAVISESGNGGWSIADAGSKNGTFVNGVRVVAPTPLRDGDIVECGHSFFLYRENAVPVTHEYVARCTRPESPPLHYQIAPLLPFVASEVSMHLQGETGTGKEVVARAIHEMSGRRGAFVARNCAAIPENLFEAELFGYSRGAFSGAATNEPGQIRAADGGTLFLDEIGELPLPMQAKLLRALELKEVLPLGARAPVRVDFRLVSATLCNLEAHVRAGRFRQDLHGRLGRTFVVPPLREHKEELGRLIQAVLAAQLTERLKHSEVNPIVYFTLAASQALIYYDWPYNVRELRQCIESALVSALTSTDPNCDCAIDLAHLPRPVVLHSRASTPISDLTSGGSTLDAPVAVRRDSGETSLRTLTDRDVLAAVQQAQGNRAQAARLLGVSERTVFRRLRKLRES